MIQHGDIVKMRLNHSDIMVEGMIYVCNRDRHVYFLHNNPSFDGCRLTLSYWEGEYQYSWSLNCGLEKVNQLIDTGECGNDWSGVEIIKGVIGKSFGSKLIFKMT